MPFQKVQSEKLALAVVRQIELLILRGILRPGERLPSERELAERLDVSRPSLREAVAELHARGLLVTRAGSGMYVDEGSGRIIRPRSCGCSRPMTRRCSTTSPSAATSRGSRPSVRRGRPRTPTCSVVDAVFRRMEAAQAQRSGKEDAALDAEFHMAIIEASHNVVLLHMMRGMFDLLAEGVFFNRQIMFRQRATRESLLDQHRAINDALQARAPEAARAAVEAHLDFVEQALLAQKKSERNEEVARMRYAHELER
jgi:GntR family transcriptional regulator, transcriptional repressor for pyruvate dehydrogenase complex